VFTSRSVHIHPWAHSCGKFRFHPNFPTPPWRRLCS